MRKLTPQEQQWVEVAYPLIKKTMERYNLSENDVTDWHGELSVALCETVMEVSSYILADRSVEGSMIRWLIYATNHLEDRVHSILELEQYHDKEIPSGLRPRRSAGRGRSL